MTKKLYLNLFVILLSLIVCYDVLIPIVVHFSSTRILSFFVRGDLSTMDLLATYGDDIVIPKILALCSAFLMVIYFGRFNRPLKVVNLRYLRYISNFLTFILTAITVKVVLMILSNGYSIDLALSSRSGTLIKYLYIYTTLSIDILRLSKGITGRLFRFGDAIFFVNQLLVVDKLMLGLIIFGKIAVILIYRKANILTMSTKQKGNFSLIIYIFILAAIYAGNRIMRGDDETLFFFDVLYGYLVAPVLYVYTYINNPLNTYYLSEFVLSSLNDNALSRALLFFQESKPNYEAFFNTFALSRELNLAVSFNVFRFDGVVLELSRAIGIHFANVIFLIYFMVYFVVLKFAHSSFLSSRLIAVMFLVFLMFGFTDQVWDFYLILFITIFFLKIWRTAIYCSKNKTAAQAPLLENHL